MTTLSIAATPHSSAQPMDLEAGSPCAHNHGAIRPGLNTSLKMAGTGLLFLGAASCLAMSLAKDVATAEHNHSSRSLVQDNEGCSEGEHRYKLSKETENRFKWALVGQASAVGLGLLTLPLIKILPKNKCTLALLFPPIFGGSFGLSGLIITGIFYGILKSNDGQCISNTGFGRS